jgi:ABC-type lipoprotein export system ATPase subunit
MSEQQIPVLEFIGVSKAYAGDGGGRIQALNEVSLQVPRGRQVAIMGRSGSGKSTLLHLAAGVDRPSSGQVKVMGACLSTMAEYRQTLLRRETIGLIFQFFHLLSHLSVRDNIMLPGWISGRRDRETGQRADDLLERVGLLPRAGDSVQKLSGGEMQRVALCRALLLRPALLLADEPTGNLDDENGRRVMDLLTELVAAEGSSLVFATHSRSMAACADEVWRMHSGVLDRPEKPE